MTNMKGENKKTLMELVRKDGLLLRGLSVDHRNDKDIVMEAVRQNGLAFFFVDSHLLDDKDSFFEVALAAVKQNPLVLRFLDNHAFYDSDLDPDSEILRAASR